jgi:hypothetical protein
MTEPSLTADLHGFLRSVDDDERYEADIAGGGRRVRRQAVVLAGCTAVMAGDAIRLDFTAATYADDTLPERIGDHRPAVYAEAAPAALSLPVDWPGWRDLVVELATGEVALRLDLELWGARSRLITAIDLAARSVAKAVLPLGDLPLINGIEASWRPACLRLVPRWQGADAKVTVTRIALVGQVPPAPVLDRYGQRISMSWPGKVRTDADLVAAIEEEDGVLATLSPVPDRSRFGGCTTLPRTAATGFFRVEPDAGGRWWYRDPDGYAFWSFGPTGVRRRDNTPVVGREGFFAELPDRQALPEAWDADGAVRFHAANLLRKYGTWSAWADRVQTRLAAWGCNTIANWSDLDLLRPMRLPYVTDLSTRFSGDRHRLPEVTDPRWADRVRERFAAAAALAEDPWLIGWFVDNELPWGQLSDDAAGDYAERYFATVRTLLKEADPNHLYLGCRFVRHLPHPAVVAAAGRQVDVLSVNAYSLLPRREDLDRFHDLAPDRPIQIGEHQLALRDPRQPPPVWPAFTVEERRHWWVAYDRAAAALPWCIGSHWFQYVDQAGTGRASNGENMLIGLVDITDRPYAHMVAAAREIGSGIHAWHAAAR